MRRCCSALLLLAVLMCASATFAAACGPGADDADPGVTVEALASVTPRGSAPSARAPGAIPTGGKPAAPPTPTAAPATNTPAPAAPPATEPAVGAPTPPPPTVAPATPTPAPPAVPPESGRWIEVDVTNFVVRLMDGGAAVREIAPVAVGVEIDTGEYLSTQTGLFYVHTKIEALSYDAPFDTYISHWVGFDAEKDNGFHSFLKDANGAVVDASTGRVSNGCIRTGAEAEVFAFAEIGMPVWVHA